MAETCGYTDGAWTCTRAAGHRGRHYERLSNGLQVVVEELTTEARVARGLKPMPRYPSKRRWPGGRIVLAARGASLQGPIDCPTCGGSSQQHVFEDGDDMLCPAEPRPTYAPLKPPPGYEGTARYIVPGETSDAAYAEMIARQREAQAKLEADRDRLRKEREAREKPPRNPFEREFAVDWGGAPLGEAYDGGTLTKKAERVNAPKIEAAPGRRKYTTEE